MSGIKKDGLGQNIFSGCTSLSNVIFKDKTAVEIQQMDNYENLGIDISAIRPWNAASKEWAIESFQPKGQLSAVSYRLVNAEFAPCEYGNEQCVSCQIEDMTITTLSISSSTPDVVVFLPQKQDASLARDFVLRVEISSSTAPGFAFVGVDESFAFDSDDDWAVLEPGLNIISFTETK